jgi:hypothetical protein
MWCSVVWSELCGVVWSSVVSSVWCCVEWCGCVVAIVNINVNCDVFQLW